MSSSFLTAPDSNSIHLYIYTLKDAPFLGRCHPIALKRALISVHIICSLEPSDILLCPLYDIPEMCVLVQVFNGIKLEPILYQMMYGARIHQKICRYMCTSMLCILSSIIYHPPGCLCLCQASEPTILSPHCIPDGLVLYTTAWGYFYICT